MKHVVLVFLAASLFSTPALAQQSLIPENTKIHVNKDANCGCCVAWIEKLKTDGFKVSTQNMERNLLTKFKRDNGISAEHASCHTGKVAGYTIEGHVPIREIKRLLREKPDAIGLSVPGMPMGSPGMEYGSERDAYDVLLVKKDGTTSVFASYAAKP